VAEIASEVQYISGGHPKIICDLVEHLADQNFAMDALLPSAYFAQQREPLVHRYLQPVAMALLSSLPSKMRHAVRILSVFRRINANTIQALQTAQVLPAEIDAVILLSNLLDTHLLERPTIQEPFYRDCLMRRIFALSMAYGSAESRALYAHLNAIALALYATWIEQGLRDPYRGPIQRLLSVIEWLYHALHDARMDRDTLRVKLQLHVRTLCDNPESGYIVDMLSDAIRKDSEVGYLARYRLGANGVEVVCEWLSDCI
jgi:hypothetical protein